MSLTHHRETVFPIFAPQNLALRSFTTKKKKLKKKKNAPAKDAEETPKLTLEDTAVTQHKEWVKFQQSIAVEGFETGATLELQSPQKKSGGSSSKRKKSRNKILEEKILERQRLAGAGGGEYPPLRYSEEETERLLKEAYDNLPKRAGKRGTRALKRQKRRWAMVRNIRRRYKEHLQKFYKRRMEERSRKVRQIKELKEQAPRIVQQDREYQRYVYERWEKIMARAKTKKENMLNDQTVDAEATGEKESKKIQI
jgi:hypothetical protein